MFFTKYTLFAEKNAFIRKKSFKLKNEYFLHRKYIQKIYISFEKYIFKQKTFVLQIKCKSFLNIYLFCKKNIFDHKK